MTKTMTIDADDTMQLDVQADKLRQEHAIAERVMWYFINHGHIGCSVVTDAFYEGGMSEMLAAALDNGREVRMHSRAAFNAAGAIVLFGRAESEWLKRERRRNATKVASGSGSVESVRAMRQRHDKALADLAHLTGEAREKFIELQFGGVDPTLATKPMKRVA